jgi:hypothetical protein
MGDALKIGIQIVIFLQGNFVLTVYLKAVYSHRNRHPYWDVSNLMIEKLK